MIDVAELQAQCLAAATAEEASQQRAVACPWRCHVQTVGQFRLRHGRRLALGIEYRLDLGWEGQGPVACDRILHTVRRLEGAAQQVEAVIDLRWRARAVELLPLFWIDLVVL